MKQCITHCICDCLDEKMKRLENRIVEFRATLERIADPDTATAMPNFSTWELRQIAVERLQWDQDAEERY